MGKNPDKNKTEQEISAAIEARRKVAEVNTVLWGCVLSAAHKQQGQKVTRRFAKELEARVVAALPPPNAFGYWAVNYENASFGAKVCIWFVGSEAEALGRPPYPNRYSVRIGNQGAHLARQEAIDVEYIKRENKWHAAEDEKMLLCQQALQQGKPREWADKIKAIDEAKKALLADAGKYRLQYLLDV